MTVTREDLDRVAHHWAVEAVGQSTVNEALRIADARRVKLAVGKQLKIASHEEGSDEELIARAALAFELAASESLTDRGLSAKPEQRALAQAGAHRAYELRSVLQLPQDTAERTFHILHLSALAYFGERWTDLRRWYQDHVAEMNSSVLDVEHDWSMRLLSKLFDCWVRLFRKEGWDDLSAVGRLIADLRTEQARFEPAYLNATQGSNRGAAAFRLLALYHWAKATEQLAVYMLQGEPVGVQSQLDSHFEAAAESALALHDPAFEVMLRWLHTASRRMVSASIWWVAHRVNSKVSRFIETLTRTRSMFELLPPQQAALQEQGLLDPAARAIVVELPTSGGKTTLAQLRILQALNQFQDQNGWVAYVAPTRALVSQITRRLKRDFKTVGVEVEQLTAAVDTDAFEEQLLVTTTPTESFHVLVATPEKLQFVIRNKKVDRPLALIVMDEAHNIEDEERGLRIELLLATIKLDCPKSNFLLLMPYVPNAEDLAKWLAADAGKAISLGTSAWRPNDRVVGMYKIVKGPKAREWTIGFETLTTTPGTIHLAGQHTVGDPTPRSIPYSAAKGPTKLTGQVATIFSERGTSIAVARTIDDTWSMARSVVKELRQYGSVPDDVALVQRFLKAEVSEDFELVNFLEHGVGVHHAGLSDETRALIEWLTECGHLKVLCATTTIAQGINFPVSSVFLASRSLPAPGAPEMSPRTFWNLAGRAGRLDQTSVGVVGLAAGDDPNAIRKYVSKSTGALVSRLVSLLDEIEEKGRLSQLQTIIHNDDWADFRSYVAHLWCEKGSLDAVIAESEQLLRNTFGYESLQADTASKKKARALLDATKQYARELAKNPASATLADATGFSPEGVRTALFEMSQMHPQLDAQTWAPSSIFGAAGAGTLANLVGVMMRIPQLKGSLEELGRHGIDRSRVATVAQAWVNGRSIEEIAKAYFMGSTTKPLTLTEAITNACRGIYKTLAYAGTWGLAALTKLPNSGLDFEKLDEATKRQINNLPAMLYHGVGSEAAVLMRMNAVPRTIAEPLGVIFRRRHTDAQSPTVARDFLRKLTATDWAAVAPNRSPLSGDDYQRVWRTLSGEAA